MKRLSILFFTAIVLLFAACEGEVGPQGPPGLDGQDGTNGSNGQDGQSYIGTVFEVTGNFTADNEYALTLNYPNTLEVLNSDVVFVYLLWETVQQNGQQVDVWRLLPQTRILNQGILQYNYDYTLNDVSVFLEADFPLSQLQDGDLLNQTFRVAVLPAAFASEKSVKLNSYKALIESPNLQLKNITHQP